MTQKQQFIEQINKKKDDLFAILDKFTALKLLVVGDLTLDEFMTGEVERLSREAPVLILRHEETRQIPGGGANAVYNLAKLGAKITVAGYVGDDIQGEALMDIFHQAHIDTQGIIKDNQRPTVTKTRIAGHARQSVTQQIVRIDRKSDQLPAPSLQHKLADFIKNYGSVVDGIVCSDYGDGVFTPTVIAPSLKHDLVVVDTQKDLHRFQGATIFTPNLPEAELAVGYAIPDEVTLLQAGKDLLQQTNARYILITRGEEGMSLFSRDGKIDHIPAFNRTDVFDVTGAGDTVVSALSLALACGATPWEASILGNLAASIVVRVFGTATTSTTAMKEALTVYLDDNL
ncbi:MAG: bifunctional hydroxymethylpyrimidine kinase/phosphomethylpyrimidine kinase [Cyanobacterium sp. T60_A2020_053]|nr:bifunctional hydroxymethylpyrimidine kinase/phosphomethylpyrimidine kinase [Cyanobacterium sp. T60_A2020_053]